MVLQHINSGSTMAESKGRRPIAKTIIVYGTISILLYSLVLSLLIFAGTNGQEQQNAQSQGQQISIKNRDANTTVQGIDPLARTGRFADALVSPMGVSPEDVMLDISPSATRYIEGAINLNYEDFLGEGYKFKSVSEMADLLGDAGISGNDSLVISGQCIPCGGGPTPAVFTYWLLKYLGHEKVRVLDGSIEDWEAAGLNTSDKPASRPKTNYTPVLRPELLATYEFVVNGADQVVDARPSKDFEMGSIPGAVNVPFDNVLEKGKIKQQAELNKVFAILDKDRPVVVYTNTGVEASLVWFALTLSGYDARLYSWRDWLENQPKFNFELADVEAKPNPIRSGGTTTLTASFRHKQPSSASNLSGNEIKLTVKGCATCGFEGFSLGTVRGTGNNSGTVQLGSSGKTYQSSGVAEQAIDSTLRCTAIINGPDGSEAARTSLLRTSGDKYVGIWNANVAPGVYKVSIAASASGTFQAFKGVLEIEVTG